MEITTLVVNKEDVLKALEMGPQNGMTSKMVGMQLGITPSSASARLSALARAGMVAKSSPINQQRAFLWSIPKKRTDSMLSTAEISKLVEDMIAERLNSQLSESQIATMVKNEVAAALNKMEGELIKLITAVGNNYMTPAAAVTELHSKIMPMPIKKPRIAIIGLLPRQEREILKDFGDSIEFRFFRPDDDNSATLKTKIASSDAVLVMIKFISHKLSALAKGHKCYIPINGGLSELGDKITDLYIKWTNDKLIKWKV